MVMTVYIFLRVKIKLCLLLESLLVKVSDVKTYQEMISFIYVLFFLQTNRIHHAIRWNATLFIMQNRRLKKYKDEFDKNRNLPSIGYADMIQKIIVSSQPNDQ